MEHIITWILILIAIYGLSIVAEKQSIMKSIEVE